MMVTLLTLLLIGSATGDIQVSEQFSVLGFRIDLPASAIYVLETWLVALTWMYVFGLEQHAVMIRRKLKEIYQKSDAPTVQIDEMNPGLLDHPSLLAVTFSNERFRHTFLSDVAQVGAGLVVLFLIYLLPLVAQIWGVVHVWSRFGFDWLTVPLMIAACLISFSYIVTAAGKLRRFKQWAERDLYAA